MEYCGAFMPLCREEARYLERTAPYIERVGLLYVRQRIVEDHQGRKTLNQRFLESQRSAQVDPRSRACTRCAPIGVRADRYRPAGAGSMNEWFDIGDIDEIPRHGAIAVFRTIEDKVFAVLDRCPHKGGPLSRGIVHESRVTCSLYNRVIDLCLPELRMLLPGKPVCQNNRRFVLTRQDRTS